MPLNTPSNIEQARARRRARRAIQRLGERVFAVRTARDLSQAALAARVSELGVPITQALISRVETGSMTDARTLLGIAAALEASLTYLFGLTDEPESWEPTFPLLGGRLFSLEDGDMRMNRELPAPRRKRNGRTGVVQPPLLGLLT